MQNFYEFLGYLAGVLTTFSFLPQVIQVYKTKSAKDISLVMYIILSVGLFLWIIYGIHRVSIPIILFDLITLVLSSMILIMKLKYKD